ncbi:MAG: hypothetical protein HS101_13690 [Planctomycetia bacterium]|nr:hypothetical protein [Planctomycetia bacterium]MCC7315877.1 hypothetical protein [Planctomycetota bacterium]
MSPIETPTDSIKQVLEALRRRQRIVHVVEFASLGLLYGAAAAAILGATRIFLGTAEAPWLSPWAVLSFAPLGCAVGAIMGAIFRVDSLRIARAMDRASNSEDRFASALQLREHHRSARVKLVTQDAIASIHDVPVENALPIRAPRELRLLPLPAAALALFLWLAPAPKTDATPTTPPEVTADQWSELHNELKEELDQLPKPETPEEEELRREFEKLASMLEKKPQVKEVFEQIAKLQTQLDERRRNLPGRNLSMRQASKAVRSSAALQQFAQELKSGNYSKAAKALKSLSKQIGDGSRKLSAEEFEATASDFDRLAEATQSHDELSHACKQCATAASSMNSSKLSNTMNELSRMLRKNAENLRECDKACKACSMLDSLKRRLNECKSCSTCKSGKCGKCASCSNGNFVRRSNKQGGSKAGWGTADNWLTNQMNRAAGQRTPALAEIKEQGGRQTSFSVVSKDERVESAMPYKEVYAEFVQKAEADLAIESVPHSYREYLRRYFEGIQPADGASEPTSED